jgi:hypothetical protein
MDSAGHIIKRISNPRFLSPTTSYDVAITIRQSLHGGAHSGHEAG